MAMTPFGKRLRKYRFDHDMIMKDMADNLGITVAHLSSIEHGKVPLDGLMKERFLHHYSIDYDSVMSEMPILTVEEQNELLTRMERDGYILEIVPHDQIANNQKVSDLVEKGWQKRITYTASVFDSEIEDLIDARSCETFPLALGWAVDWYIKETKKREE